MWEKIREDVVNDLKKYVHTTRLIITGISLGGGLACLSFIDIRAAGEFNSLEVITFGSPRVGNKKWANFFNSQAEATRIYIYKDPIKMLDPYLQLQPRWQARGVPPEHARVRL
jgi:triacylglycerol lipase